MGCSAPPEEELVRASCWATRQTVPWKSELCVRINASTGRLEPSVGYIPEGTSTGHFLSSALPFLLLHPRPDIFSPAGVWADVAPFLELSGTLGTLSWGRGALHLFSTQGRWDALAKFCIPIPQSFPTLPGFKDRAPRVSPPYLKTERPG